MRPNLHPRLVNDRFGDPGLFVEMLHRRDALLFDLGDLSPLPPRDLLRIGHVFVTHTHMDHFIGFDALLRVLVGREKTIGMVGPRGFAERVHHKLLGYEWDLVERYAAAARGSSRRPASAHARRGVSGARARRSKTRPSVRSSPGLRRSRNRRWTSSRWASCASRTSSSPGSVRHAFVARVSSGHGRRSTRPRSSSASTMRDTRLRLSPTSSASRDSRRRRLSAAARRPSSSSALSDSP